MTPYPEVLANVPCRGSLGGAVRGLPFSGWGRGGGGGKVRGTLSGFSPATFCRSRPFLQVLQGPYDDIVDPDIGLTVHVYMYNGNNALVL